MTKTGLALAAAAALGSCSWGTFDDLKNDTWAVIIDRDDAETSGDFSIEMAPFATTGDGAGLIVTSGAGAGVAQITIDGSGDTTSSTGFDADGDGIGPLRPIKEGTPPNSVVVLDSTKFVVGTPGVANAVEFQTGVTSPRTLFTGTGPTEAGLAMAAGNLGIGGAALDVVVAGNGSISVFADAAGTPVTCGLRSPTKNSTDPAVPVEHVKTARLDTGAGPDQIVVGARDVNDVPRIYILDASQVQASNGDLCPTANSIQLTGSDAPGSVAVGDVDGNGEPDIVVGTRPAGTVQVFLNPKRGQAAPAAMLIPTSSGDGSSGLRGSRIRIANLDSAAGNEIVIGDAGAGVSGNADAGVVRIYRWGTSANCAPAGPACLLHELYDPGDKRYFGRSLAILPFKTGSTTKSVLAVGQKDQVVIYFQLNADGDDPRQ